MLQIWEKLVKISKYLVLSRARKNIYILIGREECNMLHVILHS